MLKGLPGTFQFLNGTIKSRVVCFDLWVYARVSIPKWYD